MIELASEDTICFAGDWHGNTNQARNTIMRAVTDECKAIIHVGDFGIWSNDSKFLHKVDRMLTERNIVLYFVDGNHENFDKLYEYPIIEDGTRQVRSHIFHLPRGFRWEWDGITFLALGGAASIDKNFRREGESWWPEELITEEDVLKAQEGGKVDVMITHDSPEGVPNPITDDVFGQMKAAMTFGYDVLETCNSHRKTLKRVTDITTPRILFHGHYHHFISAMYTHPDGTEAFVHGLDEGSAGVPLSTAVYSVRDLEDLCSDLADSIENEL